LLADDLADRVVVTPHLGAQTREAVDTMGALAVADVLAVLAGREPAHPVTLPLP
jgi:D-3-phosphoglycerate dehydrogenase